MGEKPAKPVSPSSSTASAPSGQTPRESSASAPREANNPPARPRRDAAWTPRIERERDLHGFKGNTPEADSILESPQIRNPEEDTAPLEGTRDRSDEDSLDE